jgi:Thiamine pyrophosphate enzyme, N-terminal TPP binding domain/Coenzyme A transferase
MTAEGFRSARFTRPRRDHKWYESLVRGLNQARTERALSTVREVTYDVLRNLGMNVIFGSPGSTELPFLRDMPSDFRYVLGLHERVAAGMGLGYAMATGKAAFVNLHSIASAGNGLAALVDAWYSHVPLVVTTGQQARGDGRYGRFGTGDFSVLVAGGTRGCRLSRRSADRQIRESEYDDDWRDLPIAARAALGRGRCPEIATAAKSVAVILKHSRRAFVKTLDFVTSSGYMDSASANRNPVRRGRGPTTVITDLGILISDPTTHELVLTALHPGVSVTEVKDATGWTLRWRPPRRALRHRRKQS